MTKKEFYESLSSELKEKIRNCRSEEEMQNVLQDAGIELSPDLLGNVSGGIIEPPPHDDDNCQNDCFCN